MERNGESVTIATYNCHPSLCLLSQSGQNSWFSCKTCEKLSFSQGSIGMNLSSPWIPALFDPFDIGWKGGLGFHYLPPLHWVNWPARALTFLPDKPTKNNVYLHQSSSHPPPSQGKKATSLSPRLPCERGSHSPSSVSSKSAESLICCVRLAVGGEDNVSEKMQRWQPITTTAHILLPTLTPQIKTSSLQAADWRPQIDVSSLFWEEKEKN